MERLLPKSIGVHLERTESLGNIEEVDALEFMGDFASHAPAAVLLSGRELRRGEENRYSLGCRNPLVSLRVRRDLCVLRMGGSVHKIRANPLTVLDRLCACLRPSFDIEVPPFSGGAVGYFAYDFKNSIERLPNRACDDLGLPEAFLFWPGRILVYDRKEKRLCFMVLRLDGVTAVHSDGLPFERRNALSGSLRVGPLHSNFSHPDYLSAVGKVRAYIRRGDVYQVNLSQRFRFTLEGDPYRLWKSLFDINPAPFYAYINAGDHRVLSTSMERFLCRRGCRIETRPIKGTRKRGRTVEEDEALAADLLASPKDDAELSMIVDLMRNDLGRICAQGTVRVAGHKMLETYGNVHHLVSVVTGELRPGMTPGGIMRAAFPGGSVTGCPKIRSMEIIDELEPNVRHVYTGAIGYLGWHDNLDLSIAIRTAIVKDGICYFSVGGGVVYDSCEEAEYQETLHKGRSLFELMEKLGKEA